VTEERLGEEEDKGLAELSVHLATQKMEQVGWLCGVGNLDVAVLVLAVKLLRCREDARVFVAELQVTLHTSRGVLRTLAIVTVGQAHDETRALQPLDLTRRNKLVNNDLSSVGKVTELGLPHDKSVGRRERVSVLESKTRSGQ
jgi:hypothetical protein